MSTTRYEAATLYDSNRRKTGHPTRYLVLDLDTGSAGACSCDKDGRASLTATWALPEKINLWTAWVECIQALLGEDYPFDVASELQRQLPESNRALHNYLTSDRLLDSTALTFGERSLTCSQVEASFETVGATLDTLLQQGEALVPERAQETMGIFPLGQAAHCFLVEHAICTHFSADPFLPDDRFVLDGFTQDSAQVIAQGMALAAANLPEWTVGMVAAGGALTCILVIAVSALNLGGIFSRNIWGVFRSSVSQKQAVLVTNMATGASLLISVVLAVMLPNLMLGVINIAYFWATQCFPMALATFFWRGATRTGVFAGLLTGVVAVVVLTETHVTFWGLNQGFVAMTLNALVMVAVCLCTNPDEATNETSNALFAYAAQEEPEAVDL